MVAHIPPPLAVGKTWNGLHVHPDGLHIIYPIGNSVAVQNVKTKEQNFLHGHTNLVSAVALSPSGKYVASGQVNYMGFKARVILWDFESKSCLGDYQIHSVRVEYLAFSHEDRYLFSLGGRDDARVLVYDVEKCEPISSLPGNGSNSGLALCLIATNLRPSCFLTAGDRTARLWRIDSERRKLSFVEVNFNKVKRIINCLAIDPDDDVAYCGTSSGDLIKISLGYSTDLGSLEPTRPPIVLGVFGKQVEKKKRSSIKVECYSLGVTAIVILGKRRLLIGSGDGSVEEVEELAGAAAPPQMEITKKVKDPTHPRLKVVRKHYVDSGVSSMKIFGKRLLVGTEESEMFSIGLEKWDLKLETTCHSAAIYDVCFPSDMSSVLATCSQDNVRIWNTATSKELLRITVANMTCSGVFFQHDGRALVTSWNDGKIRAFTPQTGQLIYIIHNAHNKGVSALAATSDDKVLVSGGGEGQVRIWNITRTTQSLRAVLQEHKGPVSAIHLNSTNDEAASASTDGSCIIWDILKCVRKNIIFANTLFMTIRFHTSNCQILTAGTDRKIAYWETFDGSLIRDIEGSKAGAINSIDCSPDGKYFVTGGNDHIVKLWLYEEGEVTHVGKGHARMITKTKFSPDGKYIVSVSSDGAIFRWKNPFSDYLPDDRVQEMVSVRSEPRDQIKTIPNEKI